MFFFNGTNILNESVLVVHCFMPEHVYIFLSCFLSNFQFFFNFCKVIFNKFFNFCS